MESVIIFLSCLALLISQSTSLTCTKQKFKGNKVYTNCFDLPVLNSFLHYSYNSTNSSLSIAFVAPPTKPEGWVAWAINPTSTGMIGSQALIAFKSNGSLTVKNYNISAYAPLQESKLSFDVWDVSADSFEGNIVIFATVKVPEKAERLNQVWQVGSAVSDGSPDRHDLGDANRNSKGVLELVGSSGGSAPVPVPVPGPSGDKSGVSRIGMWNLGSILGLFVLIGVFIAF